MKKITILLVIALCATNYTFSQNEFITTWETTTPNETITIPTSGTGYNYDVDWENDNTFDDVGVMGNITHAYPTPGIYTVAIRGAFPQIYFNNAGDKLKILSIEQWGDIIWSSFSLAFSGCSNMVINATDTPNLSNVTQMDWTFRYCSSFNHPVNNWDISNVTNLTGMFAESSFNQPLGGWDVSNVMFMGTLFYRTPFNQSINNWDVSNVIEMSFMFNEASSFNSRLNGWNVSNVINSNSMFALATSFNQPLNNWSLNSVTNMSNMFNGAIAFNQPLGTWNISNVTGITNMFLNVTLSETNYDQLLIGWEAQTLQPNVSFHGGFSKYCNADTERTNIINNYGWTITDGGQATCQLSVSENVLQNISFYPNPTNNSFSIETIHTIDKISIFDIQGKIMKLFTENSPSYNIEELSAGIYFVKIEANKGVTTKKLIKKE